MKRLSLATVFFCFIDAVYGQNKYLRALQIATTTAERFSTNSAEIPAFLTAEELASDLEKNEIQPQETQEENRAESLDAKIELEEENEDNAENSDQDFSAERRLKANRVYIDSSKESELIPIVKKEKNYVNEKTHKDKVHYGKLHYEKAKKEKKEKARSWPVEKKY